MPLTDLLPLLLVCLWVMWVMWVCHAETTCLTWSFASTTPHNHHHLTTTLARRAVAGHWNDPDQIIIGDFSLSHTLSKFQMTMWSMFAAPLLMSNDLRNLDVTEQAILLNKEVQSVSVALPSCVFFPHGLQTGAQHALCAACVHACVCARVCVLVC